MQTVTIELSSLDLQTLTETVDHGTEIVLTKQGNPVAHVVPLEKAAIEHPLPHAMTQTSVDVISVAPDVHIPFDKVDEAMQAEIAAYEAQHRTLITTYAGKYIALFQGQVVDHDVDPEPLLRRIDAKYPQQVILIRQVQLALPQPLRVRSPRFAMIPNE